MYLSFNTSIVSADTFQIPFENRAFQYGDGLFETLRYESGQIWFWSDHFQRLTEGMQALHLIRPPGFDEATVQQTILDLLAANELTHQPARLKIQVWRQPGGLYTPVTSEADVLISTRPGSPFVVTERMQVSLYDSVRLIASPISAFKTLNALPYVLAGIAKQTGGFDDMILLDQNGHLAECIASNLFWYRDRTLYTPALQTGCVNGIARRQLLRSAPTFGLTLLEGFYEPDALQVAEAVFCANASGIQWFRNVDGHSFKALASLPGPDQRLLESLFAHFHG